MDTSTYVPRSVCNLRAKNLWTSSKGGVIGPPSLLPTVAQFQRPEFDPKVKYLVYLSKHPANNFILFASQSSTLFVTWLVSYRGCPKSTHKQGCLL